MADAVTLIVAMGPDGSGPPAQLQVNGLVPGDAGKHTQPAGVATTDEKFMPAGGVSLTKTVFGGATKAGPRLFTASVNE
jgi:hypothetical protein